LSRAHNTATSVRCLQAYFDFDPDRTGHDREDAVVDSHKLEELLSETLKKHNFSFVVRDMADYKAGDFGRCQMTIYFGTYYPAKIPDAFLSDYLYYDAWMMWIGYNVWQLGDGFEQIFGYHFDSIVGLDYDKKDKHGEPSFYRYIHYGDTVYKKFGQWKDEKKTVFVGPYEMMALSPAQKKGDSNQPDQDSFGLSEVAQSAQVLATAKYSTNKDELPYLIRARSHFYLADNPLSYVTINTNDRHTIVKDQVKKFFSSNQ
jgi:uncharacterized protein YdaL